LIIGEKIKNNKSLDDIAAQFGLERSTMMKEKRLFEGTKPTFNNSIRTIKT